MVGAAGKTTASNDAALRAHDPRPRRPGEGTLPNFIVMGAMKAGATSLFHYLPALPQVLMSQVKNRISSLVPAGKRITELVDQWAPTSIGHVGSRASKQRKPPCIVPKRLRDQLIDLLHDDVARLRSYMPEGFDGWGIA